MTEQRLPEQTHSAKHPRKRDVAHRVRDPNNETNTRRIQRSADDDVGAPKPPVIGFLYEDLADKCARVPRKVFGQYPSSLIARLLPWLQCERRQILHVCSGSLAPGEGIRVDLRPDAHPDILADGRALPLAGGTVAAVMLDPPYTEHYARDLYGVEYPRPSHLLREAARVVRPGGRIAFVHYITPNPPAGCKVVKVFGLSVGFGHPMRAVTIYEREQSSLSGTV
jgi:SAM-dependent methyltransferase